MKYLTYFALVAGCCLPAAAQIQITGHVRWTDRRGPDQPNSTHPARQILVEVCDTNLPVATQVVASTHTGDSGEYSVSVAAPPGTQRSLLVRARSQSDAGAVHPPGTPLTYILPSQTHAGQPSGVALTVDITGDVLKVTNAAFSVMDAIVTARQYVSKVGQTDLPSVQVEFETNRETSFFDGQALHILRPDEWDWDVIMHEYGHYVSSKFGLDDSPGGAHAADENLSERMPKKQAVRLAWGEGWPTFFSILAQREMGMENSHIPYVGDTSYTDTEDTSLTFDLNGESGSCGEDNELSVMRLLYQAVADAGETRLTASDVWQALLAAKPAHLSAAYTALIGKVDTSAVSALGNIATRHRLAPGPTLPEAAPALPSPPPTFIWNANGGGALIHNNRFVIRFLTQDLKPILDSPPVTSGTTYQPSTEEWQALCKAGVFYWAVAGQWTDDPETGPYLSSLHNLLPAPQMVVSHQ